MVVCQHRHTIGRALRPLRRVGPGILERLRSGETVTLPRTFALDAIRSQIGEAGND
jgi:hypothetical protein